MFGWFNRKENAAVALQPERRWSVTANADAITVTDDAGQSKLVRLQELSGVIIETNDSGPWGVDVWWLLFGADDKIACSYPQGATGEEAVLDTLMALPSFDHQRMIEAMASTDAAIFPVWRRNG